MSDTMLDVHGSLTHTHEELTMSKYKYQHLAVY